MRTIAIVNQKGGVGKTTSTINIGAGLQRLRKKVLLIDLDPQCHLTRSLGMYQEKQKTIYDLMAGKAELNEVIRERDGLKIIPSSKHLSRIEQDYTQIKGREALLKNSLKDLGGYDYVLIDCLPSLTLLTLNALVFVKEVFIPLQAQYLALEGLSSLVDVIELVRGRINNTLDITGVILTMYDQRKKLNREVENKIREHFKDRVFKTTIRDNITLAEAPTQRQTIFEYNPKCNGSEDYLNLCREIIERGKHG